MSEARRNPPCREHIQQTYVGPSEVQGFFAGNISRLHPLVFLSLSQERYGANDGVKIGEGREREREAVIEFAPGGQGGEVKREEGGVIPCKELRC